tara:strand:+ start:1479 stop:2318 length:840 start_codon:yes stop_codon:yes gene_type:complete
MIVEIDGREVLIPTVWDGEILEDEAAINRAIESGIEWRTADATNEGRESLMAFDREIHENMSKKTTASEAALILSDKNTGFALGGLGAATRGITTEEGEKMASKKFQRDDKEADTNEDGKLSTREKEIADKVQRNEIVEMSHGGLMSGFMGYDEVSGNPIPIGASPENVRDDIEAMISTDEYVIPAHVVKWHGLRHIQMMQDEAEMGLMAMKMNGLIQGGEAPEEDEVEEIDDSEMEVDVEVATVQVDDLLDESDEIEEILPRTSSMPLMQPNKFAFEV